MLEQVRMTIGFALDDLPEDETKVLWLGVGAYDEGPHECREMLIEAVEDRLSDIASDRNITRMLPDWER